MSQLMESRLPPFLLSSDAKAPFSSAVNMTALGADSRVTEPCNGGGTSCGANGCAESRLSVGSQSYSSTADHPNPSSTSFLSKSHG